MRDLYAEVTNQMIAAIEAGTRPWAKGWKTKGSATFAMPKRVTGESYRGINVLILWDATDDNGYTAPTWMTYKQAAELGGQVRKGERGTSVVFSSTMTKQETDDNTGEAAERVIPFLRSYVVFNVEQIDGLPAHFYPQTEATEADAPQAIEAAEVLFAKTGATIRHGGDRAYYAPAYDAIQLPRLEDFRDAATYTATKGHELVHWTGHPTRCARDFGRRFGDEAYAFEELVAELGAAFLCAELGIMNETRDDHAAYLANWLNVLKNDKRALFTAASAAQKAVDFIQLAAGVTSERDALKRAA